MAAENQTLTQMAKHFGTYYRKIGQELDRMGIARPVRDKTGSKNPNYRGVWEKRLGRLRELCAAGSSLGQMEREFGTSHQEDILAAIHRFGIPYQRFRQSGANNPAWRGGQTIDKHGYVLVYAPDHPHRNHRNQARLHRLVMEKTLGRFLEPKECVHHKDGNPANNHPDNLVLYSSNAEHLAETLRGKCPNWTHQGRLQIRQNVARMLQSRGVRTTPRFSSIHLAT